MYQRPWQRTAARTSVGRDDVGANESEKLAGIKRLNCKIRTYKAIERKLQISAEAASASDLGTVVRRRRRREKTDLHSQRGLTDASVTENSYAP